MGIVLHGIPNCDTVKKARAWLAARGIEHAFVDYKKVGADPAKLARWVDVFGWEKVLNRAGTTYRKLPESEREGLDRAKALALMHSYPSCIRRPVVEYAGGLLLGFAPAEWETALA